MTSRQKAMELLKPYGVETPALDFKGVQLWARVVDCYDGDTCTVVFPWYQQVNKHSIRLVGIDAFEQKGGEKERANAARNRLLQLIVGNEELIDLSRVYTRAEIRDILSQNVYVVWICCKGTDKYGRILAHMYDTDHTDDEVAFSDVLIREGHGTSYDGGKKTL